METESLGISASVGTLDENRKSPGAYRSKGGERHGNLCLLRQTKFDRNGLKGKDVIKKTCYSWRRGQGKRAGRKRRGQDPERTGGGLDPTRGVLHGNYWLPRRRKDSGTVGITRGENPYLRSCTACSSSLETGLVGASAACMTTGGPSAP